MLSAVVASAVAGKPAPPRPYQPGDQVWSSNPPGPDGVATTSEPDALETLPAAPLPAPVRPYRAGDKVWLTTPPTVQLAFATGCQRVPATGYIGQGVFAQTTFEYTNYWSWSDASSGQSFTWYIKKTDGSTQAYASSFGGGGSWSGPANIYQWKVQNHGSTPQAWNVCYDVRYGYNYLSSTLPDNQCAPYVGRACDGYNYRDESRIAKNSGDVIRLGFQDTGGGFYYLDFGSGYNGTEIQLTRGAVGAPSYQRTYCKYQSRNSSYVQCKSYIA